MNVVKYWHNTYEWRSVETEPSLCAMENKFDQAYLSLSVPVSSHSFSAKWINFSNDVTEITACERTVGLWLCYFILCLVTTNQRNLPGRLCHALLRYPRSNGIQSRCESGSSGKGIQWKNQLS